MNETLHQAIAAITAQQGEEHSTVWMAGEQLKDILRDQPECAELVLKDFENKAMGIAECEKKIKAYADELHSKMKNKASGVGVSPAEAEKIIRKFYGLPDRGEQEPKPIAKPERKGTVSLEDFF